MWEYEQIQYETNSTIAMKRLVGFAMSKINSVQQTSSNNYYLPTIYLRLFYTLLILPFIGTLCKVCVQQK